MLATGNYACAAKEAGDEGRLDTTTLGPEIAAVKAQRDPQRVSGYRFHLEHVIPSVRGGSDAFRNRALACATCNLAKGDPDGYFQARTEIRTCGGQSARTDEQFAAVHQGSTVPAWRQIPLLRDHNGKQDQGQGFQVVHASPSISRPAVTPVWGKSQLEGDDASRRSGTLPLRYAHFGKGHPMTSASCPHCDSCLSAAELAEGWCEACGKQLPRALLSGRLQLGLPTLNRKILGETNVSPSAIRLPRPLSDPLLALHRFLSWLLIVSILLLTGWLLWTWYRLGEIPGWVELIAVLAACEQMKAIWVWRILPARVTNAFYLRSFKNDPESWPIRKAAQAALGRTFRLSGIRNPRRRWPIFLRVLGFALFLFRYSTPKFMNLEAGHDWKQRLWRSLANARCALIDASELTPFVRDEVLLTCACLGLQRVLFITGRDSSEANCRDRVAPLVAVAGGEPEGIQVAVWADSAVGQHRFRDRVQSFVDQLPPGTAGLRLDTLPLARSGELPETTHLGGKWAFIGPTLLSLVVTQALGWVLFTYIPLPALLAVSLLVNAYLVAVFVLYLVDCGSLRERILTVATLPLLFSTLLLALSQRNVLHAEPTFTTATEDESDLPLPPVPAEKPAPAPAPLAKPRLLTVIRHPDAAARCLAFGADGRTLATGAWDGAVHVWDCTTGSELRPLAGRHVDSVLCVGFTADKGTLVSAGRDGRVISWDLSRGEQRAVSTPEFGEFSAAAVSPNGRWLAAGARAGGLRLRDLAAACWLDVLGNKDESPAAVAFNPKGDLLASGDGELGVWEVASGQRRVAFDDDRLLLASIALAPDGKTLVAGGDPAGTIQLWDAANTTKPAVLRGHAHRATSLAFSRDGRLLASGSWDGTVRLWNVITRQGRVLVPAEAPYPKGAINGLAWTSDGRLLATASQDGTVKLWALPADSETATPR